MDSQNDRMTLTASAAMTMQNGLYRMLERKMRSFEAHHVPFNIHLWNGHTFTSGSGSNVGISILKPSGLRHLLAPDLASLGQAYVEGEIDIVGSMRDAIRAGEAMSAASTFNFSGLSLPKIHPRTKGSDAKAVRYHYDVSNDFYRIWLDRNMLYSCAYFKDGSENIHTAQENKLNHICRKLMLQPGDRFLDVGCGWGSLILWAARNFSVKALGITISREQFEFVRKRIREEGLEDRCEVKLMDYRDLASEGLFDKIASVGMFEHVGIKNLSRYFQRLQLSLREGGRLLNHGITSSGRLDQPKGRGGRFIDQYVFPDGELPHVSLAIQRMEEQGLEVIDVESLRPHYAKTLSLWYDRFSAHRDRVRELIGEKRFRIWNVYLPGCAYAFDRGWVSVHQVISVKNTLGNSSSGPLTREYIYS